MQPCDLDKVSETVISGPWKVKWDFEFLNKIILKNPTLIPIYAYKNTVSLYLGEMRETPLLWAPKPTGDAWVT